MTNYDPMNEDLAKDVINDRYNDLATAMAVNSLCHKAIGDPFGPTDKAILGKNVPEPKPSRVIVVVGAGASHAACGLLLGDQAREKLVEAMKKHVRFADGMGDQKEAERSNPIQRRIDNLALEFNLPTADFETTLLALSLFDKQFVLEQIRILYGYRYIPWIGYELLAHLLTHRFIDAVINYNFDELLDQAIEDELGPGGYHFVLFDGDYPANVDHWVDPKSERFIKPLYLKPHGTASQPSTLRLTREAYIAVPDEFERVLAKLFPDKCSTYILILGHAMKSIEFNALLGRLNARRDNCTSNFYFLSPESEYVDFRATIGESVAIGGSVRYIYPQYALKSIGIVDALCSLWKIATKMINAKDLVRGIERHRLIHEIFNKEYSRSISVVSDSKSQSEYIKRLLDYFEKRTLIEICLSITKTRGFTSVINVACDRAGAYFRRYRNELYRHKREPVSLRFMIKKLGLELDPHDESVITFKQRADQNGDLNYRVVGQPEFQKEILPGFVKIVLETVCNWHGVGSEVEKAYGEELRRTLIEMFQGDEVEVVTDRLVEMELVFAKAAVLPTISALRRLTRDIFLTGKVKWDGICCAATSGRWMTEDDDKYINEVIKRDARIALVISDPANIETLTPFVQKGIILDPIKRLPWWSHNRHVTVFLDRQRPSCAIYFERRLKGANITPVFLEAGEDLSFAWASFVTYWVKATRILNGKADVRITDAEFREMSRSLLDDLYKPPVFSQAARTK
jgi:SIR2-like domain